MTTSWFSVVQLCTFLSHTKQTCWLVHRLNSCFLARQWQNPWHLQKHGYDTKTLNLTHKLVFLSLQWSLVCSNLVKATWTCSHIRALSFLPFLVLLHLNQGIWTWVVNNLKPPTCYMLHNGTKKQLYRPALRLVMCSVCVTFCQLWFLCCNCCFNVFTLSLVLVSIVLKIVFTITQVYQLFWRKTRKWWCGKRCQSRTMKLNSAVFFQWYTLLF